MPDEKNAHSLKILIRFGLGLGALGALLIVFGIYFLYIGNESLSWSSVEGSVVTAEARTDVSFRKSAAAAAPNARVGYYVSVNYTYSVAGTPYFSSRYSLGQGDRVGPSHPARSDAEAEAASRFPAGTPITVHYNPKRPTEAVLETGWNWGTFVPLLLGLFLGGSGWLFYAVGQSTNGTSRP